MATQDTPSTDPVATDEAATTAAPEAAQPAPAETVVTPQAPVQSDPGIMAGLTDNLSDPEWWRSLGERALNLLREEVISVSFGVQFVLLAAPWFVLPFLAPKLVAGIQALVERFSLQQLYGRVQRVIEPYVKPALFVGWFGVAHAGVSAAGLDSYLLRAAFSLAFVGLIIRIVTDFIKEPFWRKVAAYTAWSFAALHIFALTDDLVRLLDSIGFAIGQGDNPFRISLLWILRSAVVVSITFAIAMWLSRTLRTRVEKLPSMEPSLRILAAKTLQVALLFGAGLFALTAVGFDLSALAIFGGAIGLGIGFGLQSIISNFFSGIILLMDRSLKPGDVIEVGGTYGWVNSLGMRYTSVVTRNGHEHLIPNERLMTEEVVNWSFSDKRVRIKRPIGIDYSEDVELAIRLVVEAAQRVPRVLSDPGPKCLLMGFGESSIDLEVRFWINDPEAGVNAAASEVLIEIWKSFREHDISIPFRQTDVHLTAPEPIRVKVEGS